jgi:hypothetical protein
MEEEPVGHQLWINPFRRELLRQRLPLSYVDRLACELSDHAEDLSLAGDSSAKQLGEPDDLARAAAVEFRQRHVVGRHPFIAFAVAPLVLFALVQLLLAASFAVIARCTDRVMSERALQVFRIVFLLVPAAAVPWLLLRLAASAAIKMRWRVLCCALLSTLAALHYSNLHAPVGNNPVRLAVGTAMPRTPLQLLQGITPLTLLLCSYAGHARRQPKDEYVDYPTLPMQRCS